jgi:hypothetical protein
VASRRTVTSRNCLLTRWRKGRTQSSVVREGVPLKRCLLLTFFYEMTDGRTPGWRCSCSMLCHLSFRTLFPAEWEPKENKEGSTHTYPYARWCATTISKQVIVDIFSLAVRRLCFDRTVAWWLFRRPYRRTARSTVVLIRNLLPSGAKDIRSWATEHKSNDPLFWKS